MTLDPLATADRLRATVFADPALGERLLAIQEPDAFAEAAAQALGLPTEDLQALLTPGRAELIGQDLPPAGWLPIDVSPVGEPSMRWAFFGATRLLDSFYHGDAIRIRGRPLNRAIALRTPVTVVLSAPPAPAPDGFVFHMSRCGSTLVAQMLAASPANVVISEGSPIDSAVMLGRRAQDGGALLRAMVAVFARRRDPDATRLFIKLDCWHALVHGQFRAAFPETPWIYQYREPVEVLVSQQRQAGSQMIPQFVPPTFYGLEPSDHDWGADYHARVLATICEGALAAFPEGGGLLIDYSQLPGALFTNILPHFGATPTDAEREIMAAAAQQDAKAPWTTFTADGQSKRAAASGEVREAAATHLAAIYERLEAVRLAT